MNDKKKSIIEAAIKCFAQKGYHGTSIQEIADTLGIAKGSLYFYFKSKEDLFLSVFQYHVDHMLEQFRSISEDDTLSARGKLHKQVVQQFLQFDESRDFIRMLMKGQFEMNEEISQLMYSMRGQALQWYQSRIIDLYGEEVKPYSLDAATLFSAMTAEFMHHLLLDGRERDFQRLARFLIERLDDVVRGMIAKQQPPILDSDREPSFDKEIRAMRAIVEPLAQRDELLGVLDVLEAELGKIAPRPVIIKGMIAYLRSFAIEDLQPHLANLEAGFF
ncbi:MAG: helix-turn-helix domain-containing protein [Tumebacillaceae bacterium]